MKRMDKFYNETYLKLETEIQELEIENDNPVQRTEAIIYRIVECLSEIKDYVLKRGFTNVDEEIRFFKYQKPVIVSKLIYYNAIYKIETRKPYGAKRIRKYLKKELKKLKRFFDNNIDFYKYYRSNNSFLDEKMFVRGKHDIKLWLDTYYFQSDQSFSTSHDYKVAKIMANDLIQVYLEDQLYCTYKRLFIKRTAISGLNWTGSKAALTELIYSLYYQSVLDNGNTDIRLIAEYFENAFNIDLGNFYHTYLEIRNRKRNRTKFLDALRDNLIKKMDEQEEK
ncbi:putative phage tail component domain protein [Sphingobacterium spiritivorum ATCC 33300]|uniref:Phage tail component domain protein n=3 Tax=Sphingobacterium spiritivorum TaxID=258 RepID=D7VNT2_SPHSI|nr:putative phage tail component domain protein [Sphingobacterium spiritivorum ATCC 33300]EFK57579.1 putative phage tail component domain protein [Sphingobacterium spiritivorum ATCC 33861]OYD40916.1 tetracycline regulation of excision, RteC [Sphingobacterium cellulitidis]QBR12550.1 tetracycline regulation of excision, RteC [Sphingobacterium sp. CZ-2]